jgi:hypothetical protein
MTVSNRMSVINIRMIWPPGVINIECLWATVAARILTRPLPPAGNWRGCIGLR